MRRLRVLLIAAGMLVGVLAPPSTPSTATTTVRNVVLIVTDDQDVAGLPVMRNLLDGTWIHFDNAFVSHSVCCPSRATLLTGQYARRHGVVSNNSGRRLDDTNTLPVWLDGAGYYNALIGKYLNQFPWNRGSGYVPPGWDFFDHQLGQAPEQTSLASNIILDAPEPFFIYQGYKWPHQPARPESKYANADVFVPADAPNFDEADVSDKPSWVRRLPRLSNSRINWIRSERLASQRALLTVDDGVKATIEALERRGVLQNTMLIFVADNGFSWGSHRHLEKRCLYEECSRVPLLVRLPGVAGRTESRFVSNVDIASTIAEWAGVTPGLPQDGRSFLGLAHDPSVPWEDEVLLETPDGRGRPVGVRVPGWLYAEHDKGVKELYDLTSDPYQLVNRAGDPAYVDIEASLAARLAALRY